MRIANHLGLDVTAAREETDGVSTGLVATIERQLAQLRSAE